MGADVPVTFNLEKALTMTLWLYNASQEDLLGLMNDMIRANPVVGQTMIRCLETKEVLK